MIRDTRVASLMHPNSNSWDLQFLQPFLSPKEQHAILATPIGDTWRNDHFIWDATKIGVYMVKSGYHRARSLHGSNIHCQPSSSSSISSQVWLSIWKLQTPPKIRNFMWRIVHQALATLENLFHRHSAPSPICQICNKEMESV